ALQRKLHQTIKRVTQDFQGRWHFNTCIAAIMELANELYATTEAARERIPVSLLSNVHRDLVLLLAPFAPYLAAELWEMLGRKENQLRAPWPKYDAALAKEEEIEIPVQINGKLKSRIVIATGSSDDLIRNHALSDEKVKSALDGKQIVKVVIVPGKLVNLVVR
ncbi:MAG: class I tRNA ligase family protein, partial [Acidobacteriales bacterium]|nr:class I tRNA ligase family protein [Terriglobales bacterium]